MSLDTILNYFDSQSFFQLLRAVLLFAFGFLAASLLSKAAFKLSLKKFSPHHASLTKRLVYWLVLALFIATALKQLGFNLGVLLGAAGVLSVALGFASQTSVSNLISGLFLIGERPFQIGDTIRVGSTTGEILSIDLLSVKIRTPENLFVRIPNESLIKTEVTNLTRFPIRRLDLLIGVAYKEQISQVRAILLRVADEHPFCLDEPAPDFRFLNFGESSLDLQLSVWTRKENYLALKTGLLEQIKLAFDKEGVEFPFPQRELSLSEPSQRFLKEWKSQ
ncbi:MULTISPECIES: mechanosensitive ion channel family protein [Rheinheimera]|uniref:Small-conductance mechanosensitive channel n=1 Tax=Rheinheimera marina TaxID=1774958 RepID=A0ABV9JLZ4_9GAMM